MATEGLVLNRAVVLGFGVVYWLGVLVQARRVRKWIGRSPNVRPRGLKERVLWGGWFVVVGGWLALPLATGQSAGEWWTAIVICLVHPVGLALGTIMMVAGYGGTLWCYAAMGEAWRMGVNRAEKTELVTRGPYRFVRHPIYLCQTIMVAAIAVLLPSVLALAILGIHLGCVVIKAADEESYLLSLQGASYAEYCARTGRWFPRVFGRGGGRVSRDKAK